MATIMEKDVLLEYAHIGHLIVGKTRTVEMEADTWKMSAIYNHILSTHEDDIDFDETVHRIKEIRVKYERY